jgi:hypothetical protein
MAMIIFLIALAWLGFMFPWLFVVYIAVLAWAAIKD